MRINEKVICSFELLEDLNENISLKNLYIILSVINIYLEFKCWHFIVKNRTKLLNFVKIRLGINFIQVE
jgi:hypothetical protein